MTLAVSLGSCSDDDNDYYLRTVPNALVTVKVKPALPLFLTYYTLYPLNGEKKSGWVSYPDVYGYDKVIYDFLMRNYR